MVIGIDIKEWIVMLDTEILLADYKNIQMCAEWIRTGELVGIPTETVYGLAANALDEKAVSKIFTAKGRPQDNPLIVHISEISQIEYIVSSFEPIAQQLANRFWGGALTMVLPKSPSLNNTVTAGLDTVAVRLPSHPVACEFITACGVPIAAPSANISGSPSPTKAEHVYNDLQGKIRYILNGGDCTVGMESTVVLVKPDELTILRPGEVTRSQLQEICENTKVASGVTEQIMPDTKVQSPGMKYKHYAPKSKVILIDATYEDFCDYIKKIQHGNIGLMLFDDDKRIFDLPTITYGKKEDTISQAKNLFSTLRILDTLKVNTVYARFNNSDEIGFAVYNRLIRAAGFEVTTL